MLTKQKFWINDMEAITCIMFILIVIGTINICSASLITAYTNFENPYFFLIRHLISLLIGFVAFALTSRFNYKKLKLEKEYYKSFKEKEITKYECN